MTPKEQAAFVKAFSKNVATCSAEEVADFVARYEAGEDMSNFHEYTSIVDALFMWHDGLKWKLEQIRGEN